MDEAVQEESQFVTGEVATDDDANATDAKVIIESSDRRNIAHILATKILNTITPRSKTIIYKMLRIFIYFCEGAICASTTYGGQAVKGIGIGGGSRQSWRRSLGHEHDERRIF